MPLSPLDVAGHVAHNLFHLLAEGKAVIFTALAFVGQVVPEASPAIVGNATIQMSSVRVNCLRGWRLALCRLPYRPQQLRRRQNLGDANPFIRFLIVVLGGVNIWLFILPMAMRIESKISHTRY